MPKAVLEHEDNYEFEENTLYTCVLKKVEEQTRQTKNGPWVRWNWTFEVTEGEKCGHLSEASERKPG